MAIDNKIKDDLKAIAKSLMDYLFDNKNDIDNLYLNDFFKTYIGDNLIDKEYFLDNFDYKYFAYFLELHNLFYDIKIKEKGSIDINFKGKSEKCFQIVYKNISNTASKYQLKNESKYISSSLPINAYEYKANNDMRSQKDNSYFAAFHKILI